MRREKAELLVIVPFFLHVRFGFDLFANRLRFFPGGVF